jgi:peptidoglycan hydrolase-like protein with peptidoglycan-binding domain
MLAPSVRSLSVAVAAVLLISVPTACSRNSGGVDALETVTDVPVTNVETTTTVAPTTTTTRFPPVTEPIMPLTKSDDVVRLQQRLNEMKFFVGEPDGYYGDTTRAQVWAYQKLVLGLSGAEVTGIVTPELWQHMQADPQIADPRPDSTDTHVIVDLPKQVLMLFKSNVVQMVTHVSSGTGKEWCAIPRNVPPWPDAPTTTNSVGRKQRVCGQSVTPGGMYEVYRRFRGKEEIPLGTVYDPVYFNKGIAIHGFESVPKFPASHGCIRVPLPIGTQILNMTRVGDHVYVFDGVKEPEEYGSQAPPMDEPDPTDTQFTGKKPASSTTAKKK